MEVLSSGYLLSQPHLGLLVGPIVGYRTLVTHKRGSRVDSPVSNYPMHLYAPGVIPGS